MKNVILATEVLYIRVHGKYLPMGNSVAIHCHDLVTEFSGSEGGERERDTCDSFCHLSVALPQQLYSSSSFHGTHGLPQQKHNLVNAALRIHNIIVGAFACEFV